MNMLKKMLNSKWLSYLIFYGWNLFFILVLITIEATGRVFSELAHNVFTSYTPVSYLLNTLVICLTPLACLIIGWWKLDNDRNLLLKWFYGFQVPLSFLILFRLGGFNQMTTPILLWFAVLTIPVVGYGLNILFRDKIPFLLRHALTLLQVVVGVAVATYLLIYIIPISWVMIREILSNIFQINLMELFGIGLAGFIFLFFFMLTGTLIVFFPIALVIFYGVKGTRQLILDWNENASSRYGSVAVMALVVGFAYPRLQSQTEALQLSEDWWSKKVADEKILAKQEEIREGLLNAYLWRYRYVSDDDDDNRGIRSLYKEAFGSSSNLIVDLHDVLVSPFVYQGDYTDIDKAATYYELLFDQPIDRAEKDVIIDAMRNSFELRRVEATILNVDQKQVEVTDRDIDYTELGDGVVEVMFHERYVNRTYRNQEIFYYFSLSENCVITGMWLSDEDGKEQKYTYTVAPRGAAQKVYQSIRQEQRDPSLLEQVGPYQYRLRVFPIPARDMVRFDKDKDEAKEHPMHLTLRILTKADAEGELRLPQLTEKRNVYWKDGKLLGCDDTTWFPATDKKFAASVAKTSASFDGVNVNMTPINNLPEKQATWPVTVIVDGSFSMAKHREKVIALLADFPFKQGLEVKVLCKDALLPASLPFAFNGFIGNNNPMDVLSAWSAANAGRNMVWITDKGSYELLKQDSVYKAIALHGQLDVIHLDGYAAIYDDAFVETVIQSGGNIYTDLNPWASWAKVAPDTVNVTWQEGDMRYTFQDVPTDSAQDVFAPYYASRMAMGSNRNKASVSAEDLDQLHALAVKHSFVSPYSSMICLVDDAQRKLLEELSKKDDRFDRAVENGKAADTLNLMASPEPHEWAMMLCMLALLAYVYRRRLAEIALR